MYIYIHIYIKTYILLQDILIIRSHAYVYVCARVFYVIHAHSLAHTHTHTRARAHTHTHTHTPKYITNKCTGTE